MNIRKWFVLQILYFKRLFLKKSFIVLLCLVPLLVVGLKLISTEDNGIVNILVCAEDEDEKLSSEIIDKLLDEESIIVYEYCDNEAKALEKLERGQADAVWLFPKDIHKRIKQYASGYTDVKLVEVYEVEDTTSLKLSREALMAAIYDYITYEEYAGYVTDSVPEGTEVTEEELRLYYDYFKQDGSLFEYYNIDGTEWHAVGGYLTAPLRGMLALLILLAGIAGVMYFRQDKENGVYEYLPKSEEWIYGLSGQLIAMGLIAVVALISLYISGNAVSLPTELLLMAEYIITCALFCSLMDRIFSNLLLMGIVTPFLILITFVMCPVFFSLNGFLPIKCILPTFYYLSGLHDTNWMLYGGIYAVAALVLNLVAEIIFNKGIRKNG